MHVRPMIRRLARFEFSLAFAAVLVIAAALGDAPSRAGEPTQTRSLASPFDGTWQTTLSCPNAAGALGYSFRFLSIVKNGVLHGDKGTPHEAGWLQLDGPINSDGTANLYVEGLVGAAPFAVGQRPAGTPYGYHVDARFSRDAGEGHRVEGRPCSVVLRRDR